MSKLKYIRLAFSLAFFIILFFAFLGIPALIPSWGLLEISTFPQFIPSALRFTALGFMIFGFIFVTVFVFLFGRFYCSTFCPLGTMQDIISRIALKFRKKKIYRYSKPFNWLRYSIIVLVILSLFTGSIYLLTILDPYSNFGKIISGIFRPIAILVNDSLAKGLEVLNNYWISPVGMKNYGLASFVFPFLLLLSLLIIASLRGRLFCNTVCPVGTLLGLFSKFSLFKIKIDQSACTRCGKCSSKCKAECIDVKSKNIDFDRCVGCYNCLSVCPENGINFRLSKKNNITPMDESKRSFFGNIAGLVVGTSLVAVQAKANEHESNTDNKIPVKKKLPVSPPGSYSIENFTSHCTACHLCVSTCPTQVLKPSFLEYGFTGMLMPHMSFSDSFCNYNCTKCSEVCPTGAINPINTDQKKAIQIGKVIFIKENCVVYTDETACGACSEHCPTKAVHMVPYKGFVTIPETDQNICVGCGACEFACPAKPNKAIFVDGNKVHQTAFKPKEEKIKEGVPEEFPF
jgi:polyferredoxin